MTFLHAALLTGIAAVAVPVVLHLMVRQQPRLLEFPALRFVRQREHANRRKLRLRHWILLALRCAAICLVALALARPSVQLAGGFGDRQAPVAAALVFDTSPRLDYRHQNQTRLDVAKDTARWLLGQLPAESDVAVLDSRTSSSAFSVDVSAAGERIARLETSPAGVSLAAAAAEGLRLVGESEKSRKELYVFTDLAQSAWSATATAPLHQRLAAAAGVNVYIIDVGVAEPTNFSLGELRLSDQVLSQNDVLRVGCEVTHEGPGGPATVELYLADADGRLTKRNQQDMTLAAGGLERAEFGLGSLPPGVHQGYVRLAAQDALPADDARYFTLAVLPAWRVLLAAAPPERQNALFLEQALAPDVLRQRGQAAFVCQVSSLAELATASLDDFAAVAVLDPTPLPMETWRRLASFAARGGGVAIFLGHNAQPLEAFNQPAPQELLPGPLVRQWRAGETDIYLAPENLQHPLLARFRKLETTVPWDAFSVFRHWEIGPLVEGAHTIVPYSNGLPAIVERPLGKGRLIAMTTPVSDPASRRDTWNILPTGDEPWPFVMLANELMYYLVGSGGQRLNYRAGETVVVSVSGHQEPAYLLTTPRGDQIRQSADEKQEAVVVTTTDEVGNYRLQAGGQEAGVDLGFSVNLAPEATRLARAPRADLEAACGDARFQLARGREEIDRSLNLGRVGVELYPYLIVLLAVVLGSELVLSNRFYRDAGSTSARPSAAARLAAAWRGDRAEGDSAAAAGPAQPSPQPLDRTAVSP